VWLIDRYIVRRFLANFLILLFLLFVFAASIDLLTQLDEFVEGARNVAGPDAGVVKLLVTLVGVIVNFHGPRLFQFYAYMLGLLSVGAMGFTLAHMHRHRELVAILASGVRLHRVALPIMLTALGLNVLQLLNQEFMLPRMAPLLIRGHGDIGKRGAEAYEILFTADGRGNLLQAPSFDPGTNTLRYPTFLERDETGRTRRRITADAATWDDATQTWVLTNGRAVSPSVSGGGSTAVLSGQPLERFATDLGPDVLKIRRFREYATMLSLRQIIQLLASPGVVDEGALIRFALARFSTVLINLMVLAMALPFFLLREPANLLHKSLFCAATTVPAMMGALIGFAVALPGVPSSVSVFLPAIVLLPVTMYVVSLIRT
jgi:lipopolysaccharide export LptBFGC system permease protein LptF